MVKRVKHVLTKHLKGLLIAAFSLWSIGLYMLATLQAQSMSQQRYFLSNDRPFSSSPPRHLSSYAGANNKSNATTGTSESCDSLCSCFQSYATEQSTAGNTNHFHSMPSKQFVWKNAINELVQAFRESDLKGITQNSHRQSYNSWVERLFHILTTYRLDKSHKSPANPFAVQAIHALLTKQWRQDADGRPIRIAVFGGSVTAGHDWEKGIPIDMTISADNISPTQNHAWPLRLEAEINTALGFEAVSVINIAVAATTSDIGSLILEYGLFPPDYPADGPDIVISSFATNDVRSEKGGRTSKTLGFIQEFISKAQGLRCGPLPMVIAVDDVGIWPGQLNGPLRYNSFLALVSSWNEVMGISYSDAIRDIVLANPQSTDLNNEWLRDKTGKRETAVNGWLSIPKVHPGLGFHLALSWIVAYNFLHEGYNFCLQQLDGSGVTLEAQLGTEVRAIIGSNMKRPPHAPLPPLSKLELDTRSILPIWEDSAKQSEKDCEKHQPGQAGKVCSFAWVSNRLTQMGTVKQVEDLLFPMMTVNEGWRVGGIGASSDWLEKVGLEASQKNARFLLEHTNLIMGDGNVTTAVNYSSSHTMQYMMAIVLQSYGPKWDGSKLQVTVENKSTSHPDQQKMFELEGFHKLRTSVLVPYKFDLQSAAIRPGETIQAEFNLIAGSSFKILGLAFCSH